MVQTAQTHLPHPDAEDKAHIELSPGNCETVCIFPGFSDILSGQSSFSLRKQLCIFWLDREQLFIIFNITKAKVS